MAATFQCFVTISAFFTAESCQLSEAERDLLRGTLHEGGEPIDRSSHPSQVGDDAL